MRRLPLVLSVLMLVTSAEAKTLYYGGRAGMEVTIVKTSSIGSSHARIVAKHTRQNAIAFCRDYVGKVTEACIAKELQTPLHLEITANCKTGKFTTFYGANMLFQGRNREPGAATDYLITATDDNVVLDGSGASGYDYTLDQFKALCPNRVR
ncbi:MULTISPECIES: hypothetical protein [Mesorhizobium]|uniref:hypothetical protein n=1 Tax=Mesorhizobium TaxID=68287 RepID=UPI0010A97389|nr:MULTISPECIES: hypothetical protein [Mesorhizobium]